MRQKIIDIVDRVMRHEQATYTGKLEKIADEITCLISDEAEHRPTILPSMRYEIPEDPSPKMVTETEDSDRLNDEAYGV